MSAEKDPILSLKLESAWEQKEDQAYYRVLASLPDGVVFRVGNLFLEVVPATKEEKELMQRSLKEKREFYLIRTTEEEVIGKGFEEGIDLDDIAGALYKIAHPERPVMFSHTHWDASKHPLPGYAEISFGDIPLFDIFIEQYPLLECRVVFNSKDTVRSIVYKGKVKLPKA